MFIWDFLAENVLGQILDWIYARIVEALGVFFGMINSMGAELFDYPWVQAIVLFFSRFGWALYVVGLVVAVFEYGIESQDGRGSVKALLLNALKGLLAVNLFTAVPVELYRLSVTLQVSMSSAVTGLLDTPTGFAASAQTALDLLSDATGLFSLAILIAMGSCVIKVFFANLKRGGILLIQIAVGSLYMFSIPRGFTDAFVNWCKQVIGTCLTTFLQSTMLIAGLMLFQHEMLLGIGVMLAAGEVPRICGAFGMDTSTRASITAAMHATQTVINTTRTVAGVIKP